MIDIHSVFDPILETAVSLTMDVKVIEYGPRIKLHDQHCRPSSFAVSDQHHDILQLPAAKTTYP